MDKYRSNNESNGNILIGEDSENKNISAFDVSEKDPILKGWRKENKLVNRFI